MEKELIINATPTEVEIALMENKRLVEIHNQKTNNNFTVGDIFLGKIRKLMPGLNAAFVDIGYKKDAFLHYTDLGPKLKTLLKYTDQSILGHQKTAMLDGVDFEPEIDKNGKVNQALNRRKHILVQILKEPISSKGPRLSCEITIPGRYLVLTPFANMVAVSKKISSSEERKRLQKLAESIRPKNFGLILRTAAEGKKVADLHEEMLLLMKKWEQVYANLDKAKPPKKLLSELDKTQSILRDILSKSFNKIVINDKELFHNVQNYLGQIAPDKVGIVEHYGASKPIFEAFGVTKQIKASFGKTAPMASGAYLVIEHTEAMHVIDVNSGHKTSKQDQETSTMAVNLESAEEIGRQLRLRDIGGIIIVDFIDMKNPDNKKKLFEAMKKAMKIDRAQHTILPLSKFGLMQITRQRVRPEIHINTAEKCPTCDGTGKINSTVLLTDEVERDLEFVVNSQPPSKLTLEVHPFVFAYLKRGLPSQQMRWFLQFGRWIRLKSNTDFHLTKYKFYDENNEEIRLNS